MSQSFHLGQKKPADQKKYYIENYIKTVNKYMGKENSSSEANQSSYDSTSGCKKNMLKRFYFRRNTAEWSNQQPEPPKENKKVPFREISSLIQSFNPSSHNSTRELQTVPERVSEQRTTKLNPKASEITSNESTPRIEEEEIVINTLQGGYSEAIKKSFHDKNLWAKKTSIRLK